MASELTEIAETTLADRYYLRDENGTIIEDAQMLWVRLAECAAAAEKIADRPYWTEVFRKRVANLDFMTNTPTILNAGKPGGQLSACFVLPIEDSIDGIYTTLRDTAMVHKTGGGTGFCFSRLRSEGSMVSNKSGVSTGPLAFCLVYDTSTDVVKQGSTRRGANMMNLRIDHPDIIAFINMKLKKGVMENFNVSVTITDAFMEALAKDEHYGLIDPYSGPAGTLRAREVWELIATNACKSAEPGIIFIDRINATSPYEEVIEATNPCGEQPLPPFGACNLGSINLSNFVDEARNDVDWIALTACVQDCVRFLDNVIDVNTFPPVKDDKITKHAMKYRNIGLGPMGWADALIMMGIPYNSDKAVNLSNKVAEFINVVAHDYSVTLGNEKGVPSGAPFKNSPGYSNPIRRNATLSTAAPTGSISMIAGCSGGIEPVFAFVMERHQLGRIMRDYHPLYKAHIEFGKYKKEAFVSSHDVEVAYHVRHQAAWQEHGDSGISKTINLPRGSTVQDVQAAYMLAWETGCKGCTVYVDGSRDGVLHVVDDDSVDSEEFCCEAPSIIKESGCETCKNCGVSKCLAA